MVLFYHKYTHFQTKDFHKIKLSFSLIYTIIIDKEKKKCYQNQLCYFWVLFINEDKKIAAYEITKLLNYLNIKWWFNIADSTVYMTLKNLEKKGLIKGVIEKVGNMPDRTIYSLTEEGKEELKKSILEVF